MESTEPESSLSPVGSATPRSLGNRRSLSGDVADHIREQIFDGTLQPGQRIPQDELTKSLGVSRLPVREALIALESEGLVHSQPHRGTYVVPIEERDVEDHYHIYGMVQGLAAERAASRITQEQLTELTALHTLMADPKEISRFHELDWAFHGLINRVGGSRRLRFVLRHLGQNLPRGIYRTPVGPVDEAIDGHRRILEGLQNADADLARSATMQHTLEEGKHVIERLQSRGIVGGDALEAPGATEGARY